MRDVHLVTEVTTLTRLARSQAFEPATAAVPQILDELGIEHVQAGATT